MLNFQFNDERFPGIWTPMTVNTAIVLNVKVENGQEQVVTGDDFTFQRVVFRLNKNRQMNTQYNTILKVFYSGQPYFDAQYFINYNLVQ